MKAEKKKKQRQGERNKRKIIAGKIRENKSGLIIILSLGIIISLMSITFWNNIEKIRERDMRIEAMAREYNHRRIMNDAMQERLDSPINDEYIIEIARENGYRRFDEIIYYIDSN